jgi:quercetin dioxygenase-like cupin family protein
MAMGAILYVRTMAAYRIVVPDDQPWITRPHAEGEPARHVTELSEATGMEHVRANVWRYEPGAAGRRHRHPAQDETFVVLSGVLSIYLGDPPERRDVPAGSLVHVKAGTALQNANLGDVDLVVYAHGWPPEDEHAELLEPAVRPGA